MTAGGQQLAHVHLFGSLRIDVEGRSLDAHSFGGRKPKQVLEQLLLRGGHPVTTDELACRLWGDQPPPDFAATLQHYVSVLRRRLRWGAPWLSDVVVTDRAGYRLDASLVWLDLTAFDEVVDTQAARAFHDVAATGPDRLMMDRALALAVGEVLEDEPDSAWTTPVRERYRRRHAQLTLVAGGAALTAGDGERAVELARLVVDREPTAEPHCALLMAAYCLLGNRAAALATYDTCAAHLAEELGVDPLPRTRAVRDVVRSGASPAHVVATVLQRVIVDQRRPQLMRLPA